MGRHSVPDPEDSSEGTAESGGGQSEPSYPDGYYSEPVGDDHWSDGDPEPESGHGTAGYGAGGTGGADYWHPDADRDARPADYPADAEHDEYDEYDGGHDGYGRDGFADEPEIEPATHAFAATTPPPTRPPFSGPQHGGDWEGGEWTGSHRAIKAGRRGISVSVIVALVTVVVVVGAVILWRFFGDALHSRSQAGAARCVAGSVSVAVVADPSIADQLGPLADEYNQSADPVGDRCVKVGVKAAGSDQVVDGFVGTWPDDLGQRPALWIPGSSVSASRLEAANGVKIVSDSRSLVTSPVMLAVRPQLKAALGQQNWSALPGLQSNPNALDGLNLPGWGSLRLALPRQGDADATYLAAEAVATTSAPAGAPATAGANAISAVMADQPKLADTGAATAFDALLQGSDPARSPVHAVVATEQQIFQQGTSRPDVGGQLSSWLPGGPAAVADYPTVLLTGSWLTPEQISAASEFARYLRKPEALADLAKAGFRADGVANPRSDVTDFGALPATLTVGDSASRATLANLVSVPTQAPAVTILLDQSMNVDEGGRTRLGNVAAALSARLQALPPTSTVGLWTFDGVAGRSEVASGPLSDPVGGQPRSTVLTNNLNGQVASGGGAVSFTTLRLLYTDAVANFRDGQPNSVLVVTAGPHTDQSLDGQGLQDFVRQTFNPARPVAVNVVDFGGDPDRATWEAVAQTTGGAYQNLSNSTGPELTTALATLLD